jgi:hypothetical protein
MSGAAQTDNSNLPVTQRDPTMDMQTITDLTTVIAEKQSAIAENPNDPNVQVAWKVVAGLQENRRIAVLAWLEDQREAAIDSYIAAIQAIAPIIAGAVAADRARSIFGDDQVAAGTWILSQLRGARTPPVPANRLIPPTDAVRANYPWASGTSPITWVHDETLGDTEHGQILALLQTAGVLP